MTQRIFGLCLIIITFLMAGCTRDQHPSAPPPLEQPLVVRPAQSPTNGDSREPELSTTADGRIILSWVEKLDEKRYALRTALRDQKGWTEPRTVGEGDNWFINWADFPSVIALNDGSLAAHWLVKSGSATYAYDVNIALSKDEGKTWTKPIVPHLDNTQTEHGLGSIGAQRYGRLGAVRRDGRNRQGKQDRDGEERRLPVRTRLRSSARGAGGTNSASLEPVAGVWQRSQTAATVSS